MGTYDVYHTDKKREEDGTWVTLADGSKWLIARGRSARSRKALRDAERPYQNLIRQNERTGRSMPDEVQDKIHLEWAVNGLVLNWDGVTGPDGQVLEFSADNLRKVLTDLPDLFLEIVQQASEVTNFHSEKEEEEVKN